MTQINIEKSTRIYLEAFLPDALSNALESYQKFSTEEQEHQNAKDFSEHHNACKVAIAHVELLLKLAKTIGMTKEKNKEQNQELSKMLSLAEKNVLEHEKNRQKS